MYKHYYESNQTSQTHCVADLRPRRASPSLARQLNMTSLTSILSAFLATITLTSATFAQGAQSPLSSLSRATVFVTVTTPTGEKTGSGFILTADGVIATAAHVLRTGSTARVRLASGEEFSVDGVLHVDDDLDLALMKVSGFALPAVSLGNSDSLAVGERLWAVGSPLGLQGTVSDGVLSAVRLEDGMKLFQVSIPVSPGSSGGPVSSADGRVIGVVVSGMRGGGAQNLNFVLPINYVRGRLPSAMARTPSSLLTLASRATAPAVAAMSVATAATPAWSVNDSLRPDWKSLDGTESLTEDNDDDNEKSVSHVRYVVTDAANGGVRVERTESARVRYKRGPLARGSDVAMDTRKTSFFGGMENTFTERLTRRPFFIDVPPYEVRAEVRGADFSITQTGKPTRTGGGVPSGILPASLMSANVIARKGELPDSMSYWVFDTQAAEPVQVRFRRLRSEARRLPFLVSGMSCVEDPKTEMRVVPVVVASLTTDGERREFTFLEQSPHLAVRTDTRCLRVP